MSSKRNGDKVIRQIVDDGCVKVNGRALGNGTPK